MALTPQRGAERLAKLQDNLVQQFADELEQVLVLTNRRLRGLLKKLKTEDGRLVSTRANVIGALSMRKQLMTVLNEAGYTDLLESATDAPLDRLLDEATKVRPELAVEAETSFAVQSLAAFKEIRLADLLDLEQSVATDLWRTVMDGVTGARPVDDLLLDLEDVLDANRAVAQRTYDTAVSTYVRQVQQLGTDGTPEDVFLYVGPVDSVTRPFCLNHVGKVYTREDIDGMDNNQLPNVMLTGGGYNCRHVWQPVSKLDTGTLDLLGTRKRVPEVQELVDAA